MIRRLLLWGLITALLWALIGCGLYLAIHSGSP
jgi:hypothetical protein